MMDNPHWHLHRQVTLGVLVALLVQTSGALIWAGRVGERLDHLERASLRTSPFAERLAGVETEMRLVRQSLDRIEERMGQDR